MFWMHDFPNVEVAQFPCLSDNYGYLLRDKKTGFCSAIDSPDATAINQMLEELGWELNAIWNTHWHPDHTGGNAALKESHHCKIFAPEKEDGRVQAADVLLTEGNNVALGNTSAVFMETPGHTLGHGIFYLASENIAFVGDTVFALGCGRMFEGEAEQMWASLLKIKNLPKETKLFCAHEYTQANAAFAVSIDPANQQLLQRNKEIDALRAKGTPTVPSSLYEELETNPFLRADDPAFAQSLSMGQKNAHEVFAYIRQCKDNF